MSTCVVTTPPTVEGPGVVFSVVHSESGRVFRCEMSGFQSVKITPIPRDMSPWADGKIRAEVAELAHQHAADNRQLFEELFEKAVSRGTTPKDE